ncbi:Derlin 1 [Actinomortierella ambigua]|uniref:Derlin n=1 Tax=Actinomortierella ambigua TaxID=1343610 RepID=A0A9P6PYF6_9FUNG|nr:Derlin 1 [Actinomortierella ambigua]KAG0256664.1 Derlin 1 [Actinomortierella ambigua]
MAENELMQAYKSIPIVTRSLMTATVVFTFGTKFGLIPYSALMLSWNRILYSFQIHRLFTAFTVTGLNFQFLMDMYFLFNYGCELEQTTFAARTADFVWCIIFTSITSATIAPYFGEVYLFQALLSTLILLWSLANAERIVSFMFGFRFKAKYLPWVLAAYTSIANGAALPTTMLIGIASGYIYHYLDAVYPASGGPRLIPTPSILYSFFPRQEVTGAQFSGGSGRTTATHRPAQAQEAGHRWGTGHRLG